jgi:hypothetical protein
MAEWNQRLGMVQESGDGLLRAFAVAPRDVGPVAARATLHGPALPVAAELQRAAARGTAGRAAVRHERSPR